MSVWLKKISILFLLVTLSAMPVTEAFAGLDPFSGLTSALTEASSGAAVLNSPGHTTFYGGSLSVHVPSDTVQFISISPPSFSAGCSGINMYFGGFSFISGANFGKLIQAVMQAAPGYVINLAIRTLCPECSDILTELQKLAQAANSMGQNACHIAKSLVDGAGGLLGTWLHGGSVKSAPPKESVVGNAAKTSAGTGASSGFFSDFNKYAGDAVSAMKTVAKYVNHPGRLFGSGNGTANQAAEAEAKYAGNQTWMALTEAGYTNTYIKEIIMALAGYHVAGSGATGSGAGLSPITVGPMPNPELIVKVVEYGAHPNQCSTSLEALALDNSGNTAMAQMAAVETSKANTKYAQHARVPTCWYESDGSYDIAPEQTPAGTANVLTECNDPIQSTVKWLASTQPDGGSTTKPTSTTSSASEQLGYNPYLNGAPTTNSTGQVQAASGCGVLGNVVISLVNAVNNVQNEKPLTATEEGYIQLAPFPLYQLINDAAVYPSAAGQMVRNYAPLLAYLITRDVLLQWVAATHTITTSQHRHVPVAMVTQMASIAKDIYSEIQNDNKRLAVGMTVQQGIMAQIDEMNQMIAAQAAMSGMAGNMMFTQSVAASAN